MGYNGTCSKSECSLQLNLTNRHKFFKQWPITLGDWFDEVVGLHGPLKSVVVIIGLFVLDVDFIY